MEIEIQLLKTYHGVRLAPFTPEKLAWCVQQFGGWQSERCFLKGNYLYFKNEEDFTWFLLKWG